MDPSTGDHASSSNPSKDAAKERQREKARERYHAKKEKHNQMNEALVRLITAIPQFADTIESPYFQQMISHLSPGMKMPNREEIEGKVKTRMMNEAKESLKKRLTHPYQKNKGKRVTLLVDQWTRKKGKQTLTCLDVVYQDEDETMQLKSVIVPVPPVKGRLTPATLKNQIQKVIDDYKLEVTAVVCDNSSVIRSAVREMGFINPRCAAHELHLSITESFSKWPLSVEIDKLKDFAHRLDISGKLREAYFKFCEDLELEEVGMPVYIKDRWASLCLILEIALSNWGAINATLELKEEPTLSYDLHPIFTSLAKLLEPFNECNTKLTTAVLAEVPHLFSSLITHLNSFISTETGPTVDLALLILPQLETCLASYDDDSTLHPFYLFDPRFVKAHPDIDWTPVKESLVAAYSVIPEGTSSLLRRLYAGKGESMAKQIDDYLAEIKDQDMVEMSPTEYWNHDEHGKKYKNMVPFASNQYLGVPAITVSARRFFFKIDLTQREYFPRGVSASAMESRLMLEIDERGAMAREISMAPARVLVPPVQYENEIDREVCTDGYMSHEEDFELECSEDEEEGAEKKDEEKDEEKEKKEEEKKDEEKDEDTVAEEDVEMEEEPLD